MPPDDTTHGERKLEHLRINLQEDVQFRQVRNGLESYRFVHQALPNLNLASIDLSQEFLGKLLKAPLLISSMTGGAAEAGRINRNLAFGAQAAGIAMGLGSQRAAIQDKSFIPTYEVRGIAPNILLFANLGAIQLNYGYGVEQCRRAVEMIQADALILHLNPIQEAVQANGNTNWEGLLDKIEAIVKTLGVPVIVKEVGFGISAEVAKQLAGAGVAAIDVAGAGGTSWAAVESRRAPNERLRLLAEAFWDWGTPTAESLVRAREGAPGTPLVASGGIRDGIEAAKAIALGSSLVGLASPMLKLANVSGEAVVEGISALCDQLRTAMFGVGAGNLRQLRGTPLLEKVGAREI